MTLARFFTERFGSDMMTTNPNGYRPKKPREKFPLSVEQQRKMIEKAGTREKALIVFLLSTGAHPSVLTEKAYNFDWTEQYFSWNRPKTLEKVRGSWSRAMREDDLYKELRKLRSKTPGYLWELVRDIGNGVEVKGVCPVQCRHTYFSNRARLGHNAFDIAHGAATSLDTIYDYYTIGMGEAKKLSDDDKRFLEWLMEV